MSGCGRPGGRVRLGLRKAELRSDPPGSPLERSRGVGVKPFQRSRSGLTPAEAARSPFSSA
jgi:hypothetical protein